MFSEQTIKQFLKAKTVEGLQVLMLRNNIKRAAFFDYQIIFANGYWYAFFNGDANEYIAEQVGQLDARIKDR